MTERIGAGTPPEDVLAALALRTRDAGRAGPVAVIGDWLDCQAIIAPSLDISSYETDVAGIGGSGDFWFGWQSFPDRARQDALPVAGGGRTSEVLLLSDGVWSYLDLNGRPCPVWIREAVAQPAVPQPNSWQAKWTSPPRAPHVEAIEECLRAIADGEIYQACICTRFDGTLTGDITGYFAEGVRRHRPRKAALLHGDWGSIVSFSPELFLRTQGRYVTSSPIKGTLPASSDHTLLSNSVKDVAENIMIVDLVRNDLSKVATIGSVTVPELLAVHPAPGVWHLVSSVSATLRPDVSTSALLQATFPPASVTGTPKRRARELLREWELYPRGVYCGTIGVRSPAGEVDLNVAIRTVTVEPGGHAVFGVGGGITIDSNPDDEWRECLHKAASTMGL